MPEWRHIPDGADGLRFSDHLRNLISVLGIFVWSSGNRFLDKDCSSREVLENLNFNVPSGLQRSTEHRGRSNDDGAGPLLWSHVFDKVLEGLEDTRVLVSGNDERVTLLLEDRSSAVDSRVNERHDLEATTELAK